MSRFAGWIIYVVAPKLDCAEVLHSCAASIDRET